jgi:protein gp37
MSQASSIEWTDGSWNPVRGCSKISPGCKHCYAERFSERFRGVSGHPFEQGFDLRLVPESLPLPLKWKTPQRIFVNSMSDLFHDAVPTEYIQAVCAIMVAAQQHEFQVLTKRATRLKKLLSRPEFMTAAEATNILWGVSVGIANTVFLAWKCCRRHRSAAGS